MIMIGSSLCYGWPLALPLHRNSRMSRFFPTKTFVNALEDAVNKMERFYHDEKRPPLVILPQYPDQR